MFLEPLVATVLAKQRNQRLDLATVVRDEVPTEVESPQQGLQFTVRPRELGAKQVAQRFQPQLIPATLQDVSEH